MGAKIMLSNQELYNLEERLVAELNNDPDSILIKLNRSGRLEEFLNLIGLSKLLNKENEFEPFENAKILVVGHSKVKKEVLLSVAESLGIKKERFEFLIDYYDAKKYNFDKLQWNPNYCLVLFGPTPHSVASKDGFSSVITKMEYLDGFPPIMRLGLNELRITKSDFKRNLREALNRGIIR